MAVRGTSWSWVVVAATTIAIAATLSSCVLTATTSVPALPPDRRVEDLQATVADIGAVTQQVRHDFEESVQEFKHRFADAAARESAAIARADRLQSEIGRLQSERVEHHARWQERLRELEPKSELQQRTSTVPADRSEQLVRDIAALSARLETLNERNTNALAHSLITIATDLGREKSFWETAAPVALGGLFTFLGGLCVGWQTRVFSHKQKRLDVTVKVLENYMSDAIQTKFARAKHLVGPKMPVPNTPAKRNRVFEMAGFFTYVTELLRQNLLDPKLLNASDVIGIGKKYFSMIREVKTTSTTPRAWTTKVSKLPKD